MEDVDRLLDVPGADDVDVALDRRPGDIVGEELTEVARFEGIEVGAHDAAGLVGGQVPSSVCAPQSFAISVRLPQPRCTVPSGVGGSTPGRRCVLNAGPCRGSGIQPCCRNGLVAHLADPVDALLQSKQAGFDSSEMVLRPLDERSQL